jgi:MFS family permease
MRIAGVSQFIAGLVLGLTFLPVPLAIRLPGQLVGVGFLVAAFPALAAMTSRVVPAECRGTAFALTGFLAALTSAISPLLIGAIADRFSFVSHGKTVGNLQWAFLAVTPLVLVGALVVLAGRRHVEGDIARIEGVEPPPEGGAVAGPIADAHAFASAVRVALVGAALVLATWGEVIAAKGGKLPLLPWTLDGGAETAVIWAICAYPLGLAAAVRISAILTRPLDRDRRAVRSGRP